MSENNKTNDDDLLISGHDYDGIQELDNNLPPWWIMLFFVTILWGGVYFLYYGWSDWGPTQRDEYITEVYDHNQKVKALEEAENNNSSAPLVALNDDENIEKGRVLFNNPQQLCFTCHRADGGGLVGPNLADEYWLHGGSLKDIIKSIKKGYPQKGMLPYGSGAKLSDEQLMQLASFIVSLKGTNPPNAKPADLSRAKKE